jgi:hypothetical protein
MSVVMSVVMRSAPLSPSPSLHAECDPFIACRCSECDFDVCARCYAMAAGWVAPETARAPSDGAVSGAQDGATTEGGAAAPAADRSRSNGCSGAVLSATERSAEPPPPPPPHPTRAPCRAPLAPCRAPLGVRTSGRVVVPPSYAEPKWFGDEGEEEGRQRRGASTMARGKAAGSTARGPKGGKQRRGTKQRRSGSSTASSIDCV